VTKMNVKLAIKLAFSILGTYVICVLNGRAENPIDLRSSDNLKVVYDAGFRPWRSTMLTCDVTDKSISVITPGGAQFQLPTEIATFSVLANDQLDSINLIGEVMSLEETVTKTREICEALGISTKGLEQMNITFTDRASKPSLWYGRGKKSNISIQVSLDRLDFIDHLGGKVYVMLDWKREGIPPKFPTTPMQPPAGYEHESMAPPPPTFHPNHPYIIPTLFHSLIDKARGLGTHIASPAPAQVELPSTSPVVHPVEEKPYSRPLVLLTLLVTVAGVLAWLVRRGKK